MAKKYKTKDIWQVRNWIAVDAHFRNSAGEMDDTKRQRSKKQRKNNRNIKKFLREELD